MAFFIGDGFFSEGFAEDGEEGAIDAGAGLDDVGDVFLFGLFVEVFEGFAGCFLVAREVVVGAVGDAFELLDAEGEFVLEVVGFAGVEGALIFWDVEDVDFVAGDADGFIPFEAFFEPVVCPLEAGAWFYEEFEFHLFEFSGAEGEVARVDFVAEGFADLGDAEGEFEA